MILDFDQNIRSFLNACDDHKVQMILVGGGAVNFHGYQRHSADLDFWINCNDQNLEKLKNALLQIGFENFEFPKEVKASLQNISIKISPISEIEIITRFNPGKTFEEAFSDAVSSKHPEINYKVISLEDLISSKEKSNRAKDQLDIIELKRLHHLE